MRRLVPSLLAVLLPAVAAAAPDVQKLARNCGQGKLKDCEQLAKVARSDKSPEVRAAAVAVLADAGVLAELARADEALLVRLAAAERVSDPAVLAELARRDGPSQLRLAAVRRLDDQAALAEVAKTADPAVALEAAKRVSDAARLADLARSAPEPVRRAVLESPAFTDQEVLLGVALDSKLDTPAGRPMKEAAVKKLELAGLLQVAEKAADYGTLQTSARLRLKEGLDFLAQADLARIAAIRRGGLGQLRSEAIDKLTDQALLAEAIQDEREYLILEAAFKKLSDTSQLTRLAASSPRSEVRLRALARMDKPDAALCNAALLQVIEQESWNSLSQLADLGFQLSAEARKALTQTRSKSGYASYAAQALLLGTKTSSWPRLRQEPYVQLRSDKGVSYYGPIPPGTYFLMAGYESFDLKSSTDVVVQGDLRAGKCYVVSSGRTPGAKSWSPKIVEEPCTKPPASR